MNVFFDTEFTGLHKNTTLISIGLVASTGETFYAELIDFDKRQVDSFVEKNVINNLIYCDPYEMSPYTKMYATKPAYVFDPEDNSETPLIADAVAVGTKRFVAEKLSKWLSQFGDVSLISDVCHYDMALFIDLFGSAFDIPSNVSPSCYDINQDIAKLYGISQREAFDKNREDIIKEFRPENLPSGNKHNSLYDALVIQQVFYICLFMR